MGFRAKRFLTVGCKYKTATEQYVICSQCIKMQLNMEGRFSFFFVKVPMYWMFIRSNSRQLKWIWNCKIGRTKHQEEPIKHLQILQSPHVTPDLLKSGFFRENTFSCSLCCCWSESHVPVQGWADQSPLWTGVNCSLKTNIRTGFSGQNIAVPVSGWFCCQLLATVNIVTLEKESRHDVSISCTQLTLVSQSSPTSFYFVRTNGTAHLEATIYFKVFVWQTHCHCNITCVLFLCWVSHGVWPLTLNCLL